MNIRILLSALLLTLSAAASALFIGKAESFDWKDESLTYDVMFKWGLINKKAGSATLTLRAEPESSVTRLTAASEPWADRIYQVRDTLNGRIGRDGFRPLFYEKIANEGGERKYDVVKYRYESHPEISADCIRKVYKKNKLKIDEKRTLKTFGTTVDMLTSFYFMRHLPFEKWKDGQSETVNIFSGKQKELLKISYLGEVDLEVGDKVRRCYHISFSFTSDGKRKTSDDMEAWISTDGRRIPMRLEGKLPVGKVHCLLSGE